MSLAIELKNTEIRLIKKLLNEEEKSAISIPYLTKIYDLQNKLVITK